MLDPARKTRSADMQQGMADDSGRDSAGRSNAGRRGCLTPAAFAERFESVSRTLWCIAAAVVGDRSAADDVLQESAVIALGKLETFDAQTNFLAWMARIVRFVALNHGRRRAASSAAVDPVTLESAAVPHDHHTATHLRMHTLNGLGQLTKDQQAFDDRILEALATLEPGARACLLLRVVLDMPYREIARTLDMAEGTAMSHVHRARLALRDALAPHFATSTMKAGGRHD